MHEYSVTKELVDLCIHEAEQHDLKRVERIRLVVGKFTGFSPDAIRFYFEYLCPGTCCAHATLLFQEKPIQIQCKACSHTTTIEQPVMVCPECGSTDIEIIQGREFYVESIEGE